MRRPASALRVLLLLSPGVLLVKAAIARVAPGLPALLEPVPEPFYLVAVGADGATGELALYRPPPADLPAAAGPPGRTVARADVRCRVSPELASGKISTPPRSQIEMAWVRPLGARLARVELAYDLSWETPAYTYACGEGGPTPVYFEDASLTGFPWLFPSFGGRAVALGWALYLASAGGLARALRRRRAE